MHRLILAAGPGEAIDHRDRNGLNNQRENLRFATASQNQANRKPSGGKSAYKGVFLHACGRWHAQITINGVQQSLGLYHTEEDATRAYNAAAIAGSQEYARPNPVAPTGLLEPLMQAIGLTAAEAEFVRLHLDQGLPRHEAGQRLGLTVAATAALCARISEKVDDWRAEEPGAGASGEIRAACSPSAVLRFFG